MEPRGRLRGQQELLEKYGKSTAALLKPGLASSPSGFPRRHRHCLTPVAGPLEEAMVSVPLQPISHHCSRSLAQPVAPAPTLGTWGGEKLWLASFWAKMCQTSPSVGY